MRRSEILRDTSRYYTDTLRTHGETPQGADWNSAASQVLRFEKLLEVLDGRRTLSINDYGCGYGALAEYLRSDEREIDYVGYDVSEEMVGAARARFDDPSIRFTTRLDHVPKADFTVASGVLNVRQDAPDDVWVQHAHDTIGELADKSSVGFSFNMLTAYSHRNRREPRLFYADPTYFFDLCKRRYSRRVALLHDYDLFEFTVVVRLGELPVSKGDE
jgi:SAM-dependent methyltransferase